MCGLHVGLFAWRLVRLSISLDFASRLGLTPNLALAVMFLWPLAIAFGAWFCFVV